VWKFGEIRNSVQMQRGVKHTAECANWEELEKECRCKGVSNILLSCPVTRKFGRGF